MRNNDGTPVRKVIVHYHIFKNAGSSVERALWQSFGDRWTRFDRQAPHAKISSRELAEFIDANPDVLAVSSHHCVPPIPQGSWRVFPMIFFRHPIVRAYSAYQFETRPQQRLKKPKTSFEDYVRTKLETPLANAIENLQVRHVANRDMASSELPEMLSEESIFENAIAFLRSLQYFGIVERFAESMVRAHFHLSPHFHQFRGYIYRENISSTTDADLKTRVDQILNSLRPETRDELLRRNALDCRFYEFAATRFLDMGLSVT